MQSCSECGCENPEDARFCGDCGRSLLAPAECPRCGSENPPTQRFCNACGARLGEDEPVPRDIAPDHLADKIAQASSSLEGERKQVTVLFVDVQGSMGLAESVDPETWRAVMDRFFARICDGVHRFEGTVDKFTGDGAMALFGAPIAHEDHALRACYAALYLIDDLAAYSADVRREHGLGFSVRLGLNSGEVVVGTVGDDLRMEYTAVGHTVGLAQRMESVAEPGRAYLTEQTAALIEGYFDLDDLGGFQVKGLVDPVHAYALVGEGSVHTRLEAARARGLSRFVGRTEELATLKAALDHTHEGGRVVGIVAEPGVGKSRLCHELALHCHERGLNVTEGHGVAHGRRIPLLPVIEMLRGYFGIIESDDGRTARERIAGRLLLLDDAFREGLPLLFDFLGFPDPDDPAPQMSGEARQRQLFGMLRRLLHVGSARSGGVLLVEDLHWLDPGSLAFLENLVESLPGSQTLLVVNFRPEFHAAWMQKSYYQQLPLAPLSAEAAAELTHDLLGDDPSLDGLAALVAERTGGNPFFVEEVVQSLVDGGALEGERGAYRLQHSVDELAIPPTVQAVLAARIDRLPEREKGVLQAAAVIGKDFTEPVLRRVTDLAEHDLADALSALSTAEFVYERSLYPEAEYSFKHPLTEEVAYRSQLAPRRARLHGAVAQAIAEAYPDRLDERAALLANHWEQAGEPLEAARWCARAAFWAGQNHPADALAHWRRVRALVREAPDSEEARGLALAGCMWIQHIGWRLGADTAERDEAFAAGRELAQRDGNLDAETVIVSAHAAAVGLSGDVRAANEHARAAERLAREAGNRELEAVTSNAFWLQMAGRPAEALEVMERNLEVLDGRPELGRDVFGFSAWIWSGMVRSAILLVELGRMEEAERELPRWLELAREHDDVETLGWTHGNLAALAWHRGVPGDALAHAREAITIAERMGSAFSQIAAEQTLANAHLAREEWAEAEAAAQAALDIIRTTKTGVLYEPLELFLLGEARRGAGDLEGAREAALDGIERAQACGTAGFEATCQLLLARSLVHDDPAAARAALEPVFAWRRDSGGRVLEPHAYVALAKLAEAQGDRPARERALRDARRLYEEIGAPGWAERTAAELTALSAH